MARSLFKAICIGMVCTMAFVFPACNGNKTPTSKISESVSKSESASTAEPVTITMKVHYTSESAEKPPVDAALAKLKNDYPNVTIVPEGLDGDNNVAFKARIATGDLPDVFEVDPSIIDLCISTNSIIPMDDYTEEFKIKDMLLDSVIATELTYTDGKIWGWPVYGGTFGSLLYNKELFDSNNIKVPTNFDELLAAVDAFNKLDITPIALVGKQNLFVGMLFDIFADRINKKGFAAIADGSAKIADFRDAVERIETLVKKNAFPKGVSIMDYDSARALFHTGKAAMFINGEWEITEGQQFLGEKLQIFHQFPVADAGKEYANPLAAPGGTAYQVFSISSKAKNPDYIAEVFAKYYKYFQEAQFTKMQVLWPTIKTDGLVPENPFADAVTKYVKVRGDLIPYGYYLGSSANTKFDTGFFEEIQKLLSGETADDFIANVEKLKPNE